MSVELSLECSWWSALSYYTYHEQDLFYTEEIERFFPAMSC